MTDDEKPDSQDRIARILQFELKKAAPKKSKASDDSSADNQDWFPPDIKVEVFEGMVTGLLAGYRAAAQNLEEYMRVADGMLEQLRRQGVNVIVKGNAAETTATLRQNLEREKLMARYIEQMIEFMRKRPADPVAELIRIYRENGFDDLAQQTIDQLNEDDRE